MRLHNKFLIIAFVLISLIGIAQAGVTEYPYGTATASSIYSSSSDVASQAFDHILSLRWGSGSETFWWLKQDYGSGTTHVITNYSIFMNAAEGYAPKAWVLQGSNDDSSWSNLDTRSAQTSWTAGAWRNYSLSNSVAYRYYRLNITESNTAPYIVIYEWNLLNFVPDAPVASFTKNQTECVEPCAVAFTDSSTNSPTSWSYSATNTTGNNTATIISTFQNPTVVFGIGNHTISLNATNSGGSNISTQNAWVNVSSSVLPPIVQWITDKTTVIFPQHILMNDTSVRDGIHDPTAYNYTPGDGKVNVSDGLRNISYQYIKRGVWNASLTVGNSAGTNTSYKTIRVIGYAGLTPSSEKRCEYSVSRELDIFERAITDCKLCGICEE